MKPDYSSEKSNHILLFSAVVVGFALRVAMTLEPNLRFLECYAWQTATDLSNALSGTQPPLFYLLLAGWIKLFGHSVFVLKLFSVLLGVPAVALMGYMGKRIAGWEFGIIAAWLLAVHPLHAHICTLVDSYALASTLMLGSALLIIGLLDRNGPDPFRAAILTFLLVAGMFTRSQFLVIFLLFTVYVFFIRRKALSKPGLKGQMIMAFTMPVVAYLFYTPVAWSQLKIYLGQLKGVQSALRFPGTALLEWMEQLSYATAFYLEGLPAGLIGFLFLGLALFGFFIAVRKSDRIDPMIHVLSMGLVLGFVIVSLFVPLLNEMVIRIWLPGTILLYTCGVMAVRKGRWAAFTVLVLVGITGIVFAAYQNYVKDYGWKKAPQWKSLIVEISKDFSQEDVLIIEPSWESAPLFYHLSLDSELSLRFGDPLPLIQIDPTTFPGAGPLELPENTKKVYLIKAGNFNSKPIEDALVLKGFAHARYSPFLGTSLDVYAQSSAEPVLDPNEG